MSICERIISLLESKGLNQKALAKAIGVSEQTVNTWKKRNTDPPAKLIYSIADFFGCSVLYLLEGEGSPDSGEVKEISDVFCALKRPGKVKLLSEGYSLLEAQETQKNEKQEEVSEEISSCTDMASGSYILGDGIKINSGRNVK